MTEKNVNVKIINVHPGIFHADDAMTVALIQTAYPGAEVVRKAPEEGTVNNVIGQDEVIVADIGFGRYDHHQVDAKRREDGNKRAACGLVFEDLRDKIFKTKEEADKFEHDFIMPIEDSDNGAAYNLMSPLISYMNPQWDSDEDIDEAFNNAVEFMKGIISRAVRHEASVIHAQGIIMDIYHKKPGEFVVLPKNMPFRCLIGTDAKFVIYPDGRGEGYCVEMIPVRDGTFIYKERLPESWLEQKPAGCVFVHNKLFLAVFDTVEHAVDAIKNI